MELIMKNFRLLVATSVFALFVTGCTNDALMKQISGMSDQMAELQRQLNTAEASAATAKDMAAQALMKASRNESMMRRMHGKKMMK